MGEKLVKVFSAQDNVQGQMIINTLKDNGIPAMKKDVGSAGIMNLYGGISTFGEDIFVREEQKEKAMEILAGMGLLEML